jgi:hypothetical protein
MAPDPTEATASVDMAALLADSAGSAALVAGRYRLGHVLGEGGMAVVHRATDTLLDRAVAVKLLRENVAGPTERARFNDEARTLAALSHPGLVTVLDAGVSAERPYLVMELVDGGTVADVRGPLALTHAADIGAQVAAALAYAHERGVIHRDVKPANMLLGTHGRVKLADFGIARLVGDTVHHTGTGVLIGTVSYLSPEQVEGAGLTTAVDVYSLGLVLLELITGRRPFPGPSVESALSRLTRSPDMPLDLPAGWWALLSAMTARNPADRPTALEVSDRLRALGSGAPFPQLHSSIPVPAEVHSPAAPAVAAPARISSSTRGALVALAALVLLLGAAAAAGGKGVRANRDANPVSAPPSATGELASRPTGAQSTEQAEALALALETPATASGPHRAAKHNPGARSGSTHAAKHPRKHGHKHKPGHKHGHKHGGKHGHKHR